jgi:hypothetical protein
LKVDSREFERQPLISNRKVMRQQDRQNKAGGEPPPLEVRAKQGVQEMEALIPIRSCIHRENLPRMRSVIRDAKDKLAL